MSDRDEYNGKINAAVIIAFLVVATIAVSLRIYVRAFITRNLALDDFWLVSSQIVTNTGARIAAYVDAEAPKYPAGSHEVWEKYGNLFFVACACWGTTSILFKLSVAGWFLRLTNQKRHRYSILALIAAYTVFFSIFILCLIFRCGIPRPLYSLLSREDCAVNWNVLYPLLIGSAAFNAACDWAFALIAVALVASTRKMKSNARWSVCFVILLAVAGSMVSIIRFPFLRGWTRGPDLLSKQALATSLSVIEVEIGTIAISLATLMPLLRLLHKRVWRSSGPSSHGDIRKNMAGNRSNMISDQDCEEQQIVYPTAQPDLGVLPNTLVSMQTRTSIEPTVEGISVVELTTKF